MVNVFFRYLEGFTRLCRKPLDIFEVSDWVDDSDEGGGRGEAEDDLGGRVQLSLEDSVKDDLQTRKARTRKKQGNLEI